MKKRILALLLALPLTLTAGCGTMLERSYTSVERHYDQYVQLDDSDAVEVRDARSLKSAILFFISQGMEVGTVRARDYDGNMTNDLTEICLSLQEEPMGAFAVEYVSHEKLSVAGYSEVNIYFSYRRTREQILSLENVSYYNLEQAIREVIGETREYACFSVSYLTLGREELEAMLADAVDRLAVSQVEAVINLYPDTGLQRIVEIIVHYDISDWEADSRRQALEHRVEVLTEGVADVEDEVARLETLLPLAAAGFDADGGQSAFDALVMSHADGLGCARALLKLCDAAGLESALTQETGEDEERWFVRMTTAAGEELLADPVAAVLLREEPEEETPPEEAETQPPEEPASVPEG